MAESENILQIMTKEESSDLLYKMILIRQFEEASERLYQRGLIRGFLHTYIGEEAIAVGSIPNLRSDDYVIGHYRDHGHALTRGIDPKIAMAELCGKATGCSGGKGGSMHLFDVEKHFMGGHAIVGGQFPLAVGMALGIKMKKESDSVVMCFFGDGAVQEGEFHEAMNLASLWKLPVVFMLENNLYGMGTDISRSNAGGETIYESATSYNIPAVHIDGMDLLQVRETTKEGIEKVRQGEGPVFIESMAYRYHGHSMADPTNYRNDSEVQEYLSKDPIEKFKTVCLESNLLTPGDIISIDDDVQNVIENAIDFAIESPVPSSESLYTNIYAAPQV